MPVRPLSQIRALQYIPAQVLSFREVLESRIDIGDIHADLDSRHRRRFEGKLLEEALHHRRQPPGPMFSVLAFAAAAISAIRDTAGGSNSSSTPSEERSWVYCFTKAPLGSVRIRSKSFAERASSSTRMGKRPWSSGMRSCGLATLKAPAAMKRICVSIHGTPFGIDGGAFDYGQDVALNAFARDVDAAGVPSLPVRNLVYLVDEHYARLLDTVTSLLGRPLRVDELVKLLGREDTTSFGNRNRLLLALAPEKPRETAQGDFHLLHLVPREYLYCWARSLYRDLHLARIELPGAQQSSEFFPAVARGTALAGIGEGRRMD